MTSTSTLAWQVWHLWHWAGSDGALGFRCGAGTPRLLAWQAWHLETSIFVSRGRCGARAQLVLTQLTHTQLVYTQIVHTQLTHNRRGTWRHPPSFHVAGVVLAHNLSSHHLLTHNLSSHNLLWRGRRGTYGTGLALVARLLLGVAPGRRGCWRGRRGTWKHPSPFHVAGVVLGDIDF